MPRPRNSLSRGLLALLLILGLGAAGSPQPPEGRQVFADRRDPPPWRELAAGEREDFDLGLLVFNTPFVVAGTPNAGRIDGLGPLFVSASCDGCHNNGARGRPPLGAGGLSNSFVMQLGGGAHPYGAVLNTAAIADHAPEGGVRVDWTSREGRYPDGTAWTLREPRYRLERLLYGAPDARTVLKPRIAPAVYGAGLLEHVPQQALRDIRARQPRKLRGALAAGRFGWQGEGLDIEHQTALAFAREMGLSSSRHPADDCSATQVACRAAAQGGSPEVSDEFLRAVSHFQRELAVPARTILDAEDEQAGRRLFHDTGCAACHVPALPVHVDGRIGHIDALTDLLLHDLGGALADRDFAGRIVQSRWRTAPLWGLAHARRFDAVALLHDGRAGSVEEAILWHGGQAAPAREAFMQLPAAARRQLLDWVESQ